MKKSADNTTVYEFDELTFRVRCTYGMIPLESVMGNLVVKQLLDLDSLNTSGDSSESG